MSNTRTNISRRSLIAGAGILAGAGLLACLGMPRTGHAADKVTTANVADGYPVTVQDLSGYDVEIAAEPKSVGALLGNSYEHIFFLGAADRVSCRMATGNNTWMGVVNPDFASYATETFEPGSCREPNVEELANLDVDTVFYWADLPDQKKNMEDVGITVVESNPSAVEFTTVDEWRALMKQEMNLYADVLGGDTKAKAAEWCAYVDEKIDMALERTKDLAEEDRPRIYCIRNQEDGLQCFGKSSYISMMAEAAGCTLVSKDVDTQLSGFTTVTMEDVATWDPQYVFMGWLDDPALIADNEQWASISAVKDGNVFTLPCSLNSTDWAYYAEAPLELLYLAKTVHPDLFDDVDVIAEIKDFYQRFYGAKLSDENAQNMIDRQDPDGTDNGNFNS